MVVDKIYVPPHKSTGLMWVNDSAMYYEQDNPEECYIVVADNTVLRDNKPVRKQKITISCDSFQTYKIGGIYKR